MYYGDKENKPTFVTKNCKKKCAEVSKHVDHLYNHSDEFYQENREFLSDFGRRRAISGIL